MQDANESAYTRPARHGRNQEKEKTPKNELNIFLSSFLRRKLTSKR